MSQHVERVRRDPVAVLHGDILSSPGGIKGAAERIARSPGILHNKFSEAMPHYEITVREGVALARGLQSQGFIEAMCEQFDGIFLYLPEGEAGQGDLMTAYMGIIEKMGDLSREFTEARRDGLIDLAEFQSLRIKANRMIAAVAILIAEIGTTVRDNPPLSAVRRVV